MFPKQVSEQTLTANGNEAIKIRKLMTVIAWIFLIIGMILSLGSLGSYSDQNHILMIGIGFLVASVHTYVIGLFMALMFKAPRETSDIEQSEENGAI